MIRNEKGVTLVELLIVIVILGIIAAISVPAVGNIVENAEKDAVLSDATSVAESAQLACQSEDWEACEDQDGEGTKLYLGTSVDDSDNNTDMSSYLEDAPENYFAIRLDGEWIVGVDTGEDGYYVYGNSDDLNRDNVEDATGDLFDETDFSVEDLTYPSGDDTDNDETGTIS